MSDPGEAIVKKTVLENQVVVEQVVDYSSDRLSAENRRVHEKAFAGQIDASPCPTFYLKDRVKYQSLVDPRGRQGLEMSTPPSRESWIRHSISTFSMIRLRS